MTRQVINYGATGNDSTGDTLRAAAIKIENNFGDLYSHANSTSNPHNVTVTQIGAISTSEKDSPNGVAGLDGTGKLKSSQKPTYALNEITVGDLGFTLTPSTSGSYNLGSSSKIWNTLYVSNIAITGNTVITNLNADKVDGLDASSFVRTDADSNIAANTVSFGSTTRQMLNLFSTSYGIGVQTSTVYFRSGDRFSLFAGGSHTGTENNAGGGIVLFTVKNTGDIIQYKGNTVWHAGNDGSGSGLDADLLDGQDSVYYRNASNINSGTVSDSYLPSSMGGKTFTGAVNITPGSGTALMILTPPVAQPAEIRLTNAGVLRWTIMQDGSGETGSNAGSNFKIARYSDVGSLLDYPIAIQRNNGVVSFANTNVYAANNVMWHAGNDGLGSGLDADLLDGQQGSFYQNATNINAGTIADARLPITQVGKTFTTNITATGVNMGNSSFTVSGNNNYIQLNTGTGYGLIPSTTVTASNADLGSSSYIFRNMYVGSAIISNSATVGGQTMWHAGNDGAGSGLDADLLDGQDSTYYTNATNIISGALTDGRLAGVYTGITKIVVSDGTASNASLGFASGVNSGFSYASSRLNFLYGGATIMYMNGAGLLTTNGNGFYIKNSTSSNTGSTLVPNRGNINTGIGGSGNDISIIVNSSEVARFDGNTTTINGTLSHNGITPTSGTNIDQIATYALSVTLTDQWQDTTINANDLATGTYIVQVLIDDDANGGTQNTEYYSGVMSWYSGDTDSLTTDEIMLHRAGISPGSNAIFLRIARTLTANVNDMVLQISGTNNDSSSSTVTFKFRRMI